MQGDTPLLRQWTLLTALGVRRRGMTVREMAEESGANIRSIRRDLATLQRVGFPLKETVSDHGRKHWRLAGDSNPPPMSFTWAEAISLYLGRRFFEPLAGTYLWDGAQSAFAKIRAVLGDDALRYLEKMAAGLHHTAPGASDYSTKAEIIDSLMVGIEDRRIVLISYHSERATEAVTYEVYPLGVVYHRASLYLVAFSTDHNELRHFKVDRIESAETQGLKFQLPESLRDFNLADHVRRAFGIFDRSSPPVRVRIRFARAVARYVQESRWHDTQRLTRDADGAVIAEFTLTATEEVKSWTLSFGPHAEVLEPESLREEIAGDLQAALEQYGSVRTQRARDL